MEHFRVSHCSLFRLFSYNMSFGEQSDIMRHRIVWEPHRNHMSRYISTELWGSVETCMCHGNNP